MDTHASFNKKYESIEFCQSNITLIADETTFGEGTLYVADSKLYWKNCSQVISINYYAMNEFFIWDFPGTHEKSCLVIYLYLNYNTPDVDEVNQNEDKKEKLKSIIRLVPDNPEFLNKMYEAITDVQPLHYRHNTDDEDEVEGSDQESNLTDISLRESEDYEDSENEVERSDQESNLTDISLRESEDYEDSENEVERSDQESNLTDISLRESEDYEDSENEVERSDQESNLTDISLREFEDHEDSNKNSHISISSDYTLEDQEAGSIDVSNQYHELDAKIGEKENQDEEVLINERKRKFEDLPEQEEKPTKKRKLWNLMKYPFQKITSFNTSISENEPNISMDEVIAGIKNSLKPETAVCENNSDNVKAEEKNSQNNSETDGENEDTSTNETSQQFCKIM